ncbi:hypothetical protein JTE90_007691 [Oedothorax gibbosus]|uniref:DUF155 domain-containing protein n=1 Tax=Oedothorax gibbosus TaxID=931172 RepID=A0AAV6UJI0_9ARAC|nr:hypothetical protein JTE90_007691 [Oedothorax gibbosus]
MRPNCKDISEIERLLRVLGVLETDIETGSTFEAELDSNINKMLQGSFRSLFSINCCVRHSSINKFLQISNRTYINALKKRNQHSFLTGNRTFVAYAKVLCKEATPFNPLESSGIQKSIAALQAKKRVPKRKAQISKEDLDQKAGQVVAYSSAEEYDIERLTVALEKKGLYQLLQLPEDADEVIHVSAKYQVGNEPRHIYFFSEGSVVFWNVPDLEQQTVLRFLKPFETNSFDPELVAAEKEDLDYIYSEKGTKFSNGRIILSSEGDTDFYTYTFSNSLALSVKLAMWEAALENYIDSMEWVTENMKKGEEISMSRNQVFKKRGELFALRHVINLSSDLLDTPDFYWDRQDLEVLYQQTCNHLNTAKRTKLSNNTIPHQRYSDGTKLLFASLP